MDHLWKVEGVKMTMLLPVVFINTGIPGTICENPILVTYGFGDEKQARTWAEEFSARASPRMNLVIEVAFVPATELDKSDHLLAEGVLCAMIEPTLTCIQRIFTKKILFADWLSRDDRLPLSVEQVDAARWLMSLGLLPIDQSISLFS